MAVFKKYPVLGLLICLIFLHFFKDDRNEINMQYQTLLPSLKSEPLKALPQLENLLSRAEKQLDAQDTLLANLYFSAGKIHLDFELNSNKALDFNEKALQIRIKNLPPNSPKLTQSYHNTAIILRRRNRYEQAKAYASKAIEIKMAAAKIDTASLIRSYYELALSTRLSGDYSEAINIANKVQQLAVAVKDSFNIGESFITLGSAYFSLNNYPKAVENYTQGLNIFKDGIKRNGTLPFKREAAICLSNIGSTYRELNQPTLSLSYLEESRKAYLEVFDITKDSIVMINAANAVYEAGNVIARSVATEEGVKNYSVALKNYNTALQMFGDAKHPFVMECHTAIGDILLKQNKADDALKAYQNAINVGVGGVKEDDVLKNPVLSDIIFPELLTAFSAKAKALFDKNNMQAAFETIEKCDTIISRLQQTYQADNSKYFLAEKALPIYEKGIVSALKLYEKTSDKRYADAAIAFCERNKALVLLDNLKDDRAKNFGGVPDTLRQEERNLKADVAYFQKQLYETGDSLKPKFQDAVFDAKQALMTFNKQLEKDYPNYFKLKNQTQHPLSIAAIQAALDTQTVAIEYFLGDTTLYIFSFSQKDFLINTEKLSATFLIDFKELRKSMSDEKFIADSAALAEQVFLKSSFSFYQLLLERPLSHFNKNNSSVSRLRIIPDGVLGYLPFELLTTEKAATWKGNSIPYLLRKYAVSYAYSNQLLENSIEKNEAIFGSSVNNFGGFGIEYSDKALEKIENDLKADTISTSRGGKLSKLAFADDEVKNIHNLLGKGTIFLNDDATKFAFMQNASNHGILHLAMHGAIDEKNPLNSGLIFSKKDSTDNNYLSGYDLYAMQLKTGLAVLSACNTGNGELRRGEGVMSLARAFAFAGCPSTVMSLWSIPDESTSKVMLSFYKSLKNGDSKDVALQKAKLEYLQNCPPQYSIPNYWGATVIIGNIEALDFKAWYQKPLAIGLGIVALFALLIFILRRRKK